MEAVPFEFILDGYQHLPDTRHAVWDVLRGGDGAADGGGGLVVGHVDVERGRTAA